MNQQLRQFMLFLLNLFSTCNISDLAEVQEYLSEYTTRTFDITQKQIVFEYILFLSMKWHRFFIDMISTRNESDVVIADLLRLVIIPNFSSTYDHSFYSFDIIDLSSWKRRISQCYSLISNCSNDMSMKF